VKFAIVFSRFIDTILPSFSNTPSIASNQRDLRAQNHEFSHLASLPHAMKLLMLTAGA
jgi:hypothetical protein